MPDFVEVLHVVEAIPMQDCALTLYIRERKLWIVWHSCSEITVWVRGG